MTSPWGWVLLGVGAWLVLVVPIGLIVGRFIFLGGGGDHAAPRPESPWTDRDD